MTYLEWRVIVQFDTQSRRWTYHGGTRETHGVTSRTGVFDRNFRTRRGALHSAKRRIKREERQRLHDKHGERVYRFKVRSA